MPKKRLIDATDLVRRVLEERDKIRLEVVPRYGFGVHVPDQHGQAMVGGIRKALREIETSPTVDAVEVVRCKDCEEYIPWLEGRICGRIGSYFGNTKPDDFCSSGIRKMDAEVEG
jgi:hypothetical protein